jgi:hypothetical protein
LAPTPTAGDDVGVLLTLARILLALAAAAVLLGGGYWIYTELYANPRVAREIAEHPDGERAQKVMLLTLPSSRQIPVNYWREGDIVYAGADGAWWKELRGQGRPVTVFIRGEELEGIGRAVRDDPEYTERIFAKLRPGALAGFGTLVEIRLGAATETESGAPPTEPAPADAQSPR